jgi:hypothetical protein
MDYSDKTPSGQDKITRYGWDSIKDERGELLWIDKHDLHIEVAYQREVAEDKVTKISKAWSWLHLGVLVVAKRDGRLWVVDGQHRVLAARRRSDIADLPCIVFPTKDISSEAKGFLGINTLRKPLDSVAKQNARSTAGDDVARFVDECMQELGVTLTRHARKWNECRCAEALYAHAVSDSKDFKEIIALCVDLAKQPDKPINNKFIGGMFYLLRNVGEGVRDQRLVARIKQVGFVSLNEAAAKKPGQFERSHAKTWAEGMLLPINYRLKTPFEFRRDRDA